MRVFAEQDGIYDFLPDAHPLISRELGAIGAQDSAEPGFIRTFERWLKMLDEGREDFPSEERSSPFLKNALFHRKQIKELLARYPLDGGSLLVELGADHCWASGIFIDRGARVIAVDISDHLRMAPRKDSEMLLRLKADMNRLPVRDGSADYVFANACAHHSWDLQQTFNEAYRVLKRSGRFYLCSEPMPATWRYLLFRLFDNFGKREREAGINETLVKRSSWTSAAESTGFVPVLVFPRYSREEIGAKLEEKGLPRFLGRPVAALLKTLQVSIHMVADKSRASD